MEEVELSAPSAGQLLLTPEGYQSLQEELENLTLVKRAEIAERIRDSKQHGEFSEDNSELDEIKFEQAIVETRIAELKTIFSNAQMLDPEAVSTDRVGIGARVTVKDVDRGAEFEVRIVASIEADPDRDLISTESPMGRALFDQPVGSTVEFQAPAGKLRYNIVSISR